MSLQNVTGEWSEQAVRERLRALGLEAERPARDVGVDLEVWHPSNPAKRLNLQVKGRGVQQTNDRNRWFQIRTTPKQREDTVKAGLPVSEAWRKKVDLCEFFVLASRKHEEFWVFPAEVVREVIQHNRARYGQRPDNVRGEQAEMDLDIEHEGRPLTEIYAAYRNSFSRIVDHLPDPATDRGGDAEVRRKAPPVAPAPGPAGTVVERWRAAHSALAEFRSYVTERVPTFEIVNETDRTWSDEEYRERRSRRLQEPGVYLMFDDDGVLLYVGVARWTFDKRVWTHDQEPRFLARPRRWIDLIPFPRECAFLASALEHFLIERLRPVHNVQHNTAPVLPSDAR